MFVIFSPLAEGRLFADDKNRSDSKEPSDARLLFFGETPPIRFSVNLSRQLLNSQKLRAYFGVIHLTS